MAKKLVFIEFVDEAEVFLIKHLGKCLCAHKATGTLEIDNDFIIVSFNPKVKAFFQDRGIKTQDSFNYCDTDSHYRMIEVLKGYTDELREKCKIVDINGVTSSYIENVIFSLRGIISTWLYRVEVISSCIEKTNPDVIVVIDSGKTKVNNSICTESEERYLADIIQQVTRRKDIKIIKVRHKINRNKKCFKSILRIGKNILSNIMSRFVSLPKDYILLSSEGHSMGSLAKDLLKDEDLTNDICYMRAPKRGQFLKSFSLLPKHLYLVPDRKVKMDREFLNQRNIFSKNVLNVLKGIKYKSVLIPEWIQRKYLEVIQRRMVDTTYFESCNLYKYLLKSKPKFVISQYARETTAVLGELTNLKGIPSLMIPHGSFTSIYNKYSLMEWEENALGVVNTSCKYVAKQTPLIEDFLSDVKTNSIPVITGPLIFARENTKRNEADILKGKFTSSDKKIILHAGTPKSRRYQRFVNYETIDEYVDGIASLIRVVDKMEGCHLIVRYRPIDGLTVEDLHKILPKSENFSISSSGDFIDYLGITDILVSYSSSTMEEALQNNIPVLVYNKYQRYKHLKGSQIVNGEKINESSAVYNVDSENDLEYALNWIKKNHVNKEELFSKYKYDNSEIVKVSELIFNN